MRLREFPGVLRGAAVSLAICSLADPSLAQTPGSIGGSIGKRDKSISGEKVVPNRREPARQRERREDETRASPSVGGHWSWSCDCSSGNSFRGTLNFAQTGSDFTGTMMQPNRATGVVSDGKVSGGRVSFTVTLTNVIERTEHWTGHLSGGHMQGTVTTRFDGICQFTADR